MIRPLPLLRRIVEDDEQLGENDNGAEDEDMDGVEATGDIGSGKDDSESGRGSSCDGEVGDYGYEDEEDSKVDEEMDSEMKEVDEFLMTSLMALQTCNSSQYYSKKHN